MELNLDTIDRKSNIHFIGIGGVSMSALARILVKAGFSVSGSDMKESDATKALEEIGVKIMIGQKKENAECADIAVYTAAISEDNEELKACREKGIPTYERPILLGAIMKKYRYPVAVSGTHGKTTTTSMLSHIFMAAGLDPTVLVGGNLKSIEGNLRLGENRDYFITEACEYHESFLSFYPYASIVLNVDADHLDYFKNMDNIRACFKKFIGITPADGFVAVNGDDEDVRMIIKDAPCRVITYGLSKANDFWATDIEYNENGCPSFSVMRGDEKLGTLSLSVHGAHNVLNALSCVIVSVEYGIEFDKIAEGIQDFMGTDRRFQEMGEANGVMYIDDYAHHPTEIKATLTAAQEMAKSGGYNRIFCAFQPHTYSRTHLLFDDFTNAFGGIDVVAVSDIYAAREIDTGIINSAMLTDGINKVSANAHYTGSLEDTAEYIRSEAKAGDIVITMGAGDIYKVCYMLKDK